MTVGRRAAAARMNDAVASKAVKRVASESSDGAALAVVARRSPSSGAICAT